VIASRVNFRQDNNWAWSLRGRLGTAFGDKLVYATGGFARTSITHTAGNSGGTWENTEQRDGWVAGLGYERKVHSNISLRLELTHTEYGRQYAGHRRQRRSCCHRRRTWTMRATMSASASFSRPGFIQARAGTPGVGQAAESLPRGGVLDRGRIVDRRAQ
jgi:opacity protein-like surface antigen